MALPSVSVPESRDLCIDQSDVTGPSESNNQVPASSSSDIVLRKDSDISSKPRILHLPPRKRDFNKLTHGYFYESPPPFDRVSSNLRSSRKESSNREVILNSMLGVPSDRATWRRHSNGPPYDGLVDGLTPKDPVFELRSSLTAASSSADSGYGGSEATRSTPSRPRDEVLKRRGELLWCCQLCHRSFDTQRRLRSHERSLKHGIHGGTESGMEAGYSSEDSAVIKSAGVNYLHKLAYCLSKLRSQLPKGSSNLLAHKINGVTTSIKIHKYDTTNITIDVYETMGPKPPTLPTNSGAAQLGSFPSDVRKSQAEPQYEQLQPPPPPRQVFKARGMSASPAMDHDNMDAIMDQQPVPTIEAPEIMSDPHTPLILSPSENSAHSSSKDEVKLMDYQEYNTTDELDKAEVDDDSDSECDDVTTWNCSQRDALPSFLPYVRSYDADTSFPYGDSPCGDSPDSGSTTSGTKSDTPASSASGLIGGNDLQGNGYTSSSAGISASNNSNNPNLRIKDGMRTNFASDPQPLPLICWYAAAGIACTAKYVKMSTEVRHLWNDHAWGKKRQGPHHRLPDACQRCKRLFCNQQLLEEHVLAVIPCRTLSSVELEDLNREPKTLGISLDCKEAIDDLRNRIDKEMKVNKVPALYNSETMTLLKQRVESNLLLYINGSQTSEKTARSQLWKWYLIFKHLRPDDKVPKNPFIPARQPARFEGKSRADACLMFMRNLAQEECLSALDDDQRRALGRVFLDTVEMLGLNQANNGRRSAKNTTRNPRKRQRFSPSDDHGSVSDSADPTVAPTTPALAPDPIPVEVPRSVQNPVDFLNPTFTLPEAQNQLLPQTPSSVPRSFMPSTHDFWLLQQQNQQHLRQQEAEEAHSLSSTGNFDYINLSTDYGGLSEFGTRDC